MTAHHLYFSLIPEALIASMLPPEQFGQYYATGHKYKSKGQAVFFEVDSSFRHEYFDIDGAFAKCVPQPDGMPKHSVYISMYRVLEHLDINALGTLYLTTGMGATLGLQRSEKLPSMEWQLHMYQCISPINSLVVSALSPFSYYEDIATKPSKFFKFPGVCFVELELGRLAHDPENGQEGDLPYTFIQHLREALMTLHPETKHNKLVHRVHSLEFPYRMIKNGFYIGIGDKFVYYPMLSQAVLKKDYNNWWRSANL
jgi:hypothetical protein